MSNITRRRFLKITALGLTLPFCQNFLFAKERNKISWEGVALGSEVNMTLFHENIVFAKEAINICVNEIKRLEDIFSLFNKNSSISLLNQNHYLKNPSKELIEVLTFANEISILTDGAFDVTVQPLWLLHANYFNNDKNRDENKLKDEIEKVKQYVSYKNILISNNSIEFKHQKTQITLNSIAQGYITDKVTNILKEKGFKNVLVNLGEFNCIGGYDDNRDWNIATPYLKDIKYLKLNNSALASSGGYGTQFNEKYHHLFDTKTGTSANFVNSVTVKAQNATLADAISTAVFVMPENQREKIKNVYPNIEIYTS